MGLRRLSRHTQHVPMSGQLHCIDRLAAGRHGASRPDWDPGSKTANAVQGATRVPLLSAIDPVFEQQSDTSEQARRGLQKSATDTSS